MENGGRTDFNQILAEPGVATKMVHLSTYR